MTDATTLQAVLFDMDGTLVDSEKVWQAALGELAERHGARLSDETRRAMLGTTTPVAMKILYDEIDQPWQDHEAGGRWLEDRVMAMFAGGVMWRPGARELLLAVKAAGIKTALVTATVRHITEAMLDTLGRENFDVVITDDDVTLGKPNPEPYECAAAALGVPTDHCVAIEDSPTGCAAALAAGCAVLAVPAEVDLSHLTAVTHARSLVDIDVAFLRRLIRDTTAGR
jgi:HAD superfamily hydrolase (TIGR01509 family)